MTDPAVALAEWAHGMVPGPGDLDLARRSLLDTVAVALAARDHRVTKLAAGLPGGARWAVAAHVLDFDDLHLESTTHISAVCVPTALATGGGARAYLAAAGVMARLGAALDWPHYSAGWHATCTAGAPAAAVGAAVAAGLPVAQIATAIALAVPAAGGVRRAFGTDAKSLQVGFAVDAGIRAARLAAAGAQADPAALAEWMRLVGGNPDAVDTAESVAVPGGLAIKIYPCCYALQRPISALAELTGSPLDPGQIGRIELRTPAAAVVPLIHHQPDTGLQGKFSLEYGAAAALLDGYPGFASFTDEAVRRPTARRLTGLVDVTLEEDGSGLLAGELRAAVHTTDGAVRELVQRYPPGSPARPPDDDLLRTKLAGCVAGTTPDPATWTWDNAASILRDGLAA